MDPRTKWQDARRHMPGASPAQALNRILRQPIVAANSTAIACEMENRLSCREEVSNLFVTYFR